MAGIDHTIIAFHNGMLMQNTEFYNFEKEKCSKEKTFLPFETNRDGFISINRKDFDLILPSSRAYNPNDKVNLFSKYGFHRLLYKLQAKKFKKQFEKHPYYDECPENYKIRYYYKTIGSDAETEFKRIFVYENIKKQFSATFYIDYKTENSYIVFGGYGHYENPYLHFYERGYGRQFEKKMATECFNWLCDDLLKDMLREYCNYNEYDFTDALDMIHRDLNFVSFWDRPEKDKYKLIKLDEECSDKAKELFDKEE